MRSVLNRLERKIRRMMENHSGNTLHSGPGKRGRWHRGSNLGHSDRPIFLPNATKQLKNLWPGKAMQVPPRPHRGRLEQWKILYFDRRLYGRYSLGYCVKGKPIDNPDWPGCGWVITSPVIKADPSGEITTTDSVYQLGKPDENVPKNFFPCPI